ncbi:MAG: hypothetical protein IJ493_04070 [Clostridia bacterium]|nr:hypothetical protein [Clostridia bacterium]
MKFTRVLTLLMVGILVALSLGSCSSGPAAPITTVTLIIENPDDPENPILNTTVEVQDENPTVLMAFQEGCIANEISYVLTDAEDSVRDIKDYKDVTVDGLTYYWIYLIDGVEPTQGKANANAISEGQTITYQYIVFDPAAEDE